MHADAAEHEEPNSRLDDAPEVGVATVDHAVPFQCSVSVPNRDAEANSQNPAAQQLAAWGQDTVSSALYAATLGALTADHVVPFQCSISVRVKVPAAREPTAQQSRAAVQVMPLRKEFADPAAGALTSDHRVPSHRSARGNEGNDPLADAW
jgi:hypothetical protein